MDAAFDHSRPGPARAGLDRLRLMWRRGRVRRFRAVGLLCLLASLLVLGVALVPAIFPITSLMVPLLLGSLVLNPRQLPWFVAWIVVLATTTLVLQQEVSTRIVAVAVIEALMVAIVLVTARRRSSLGVAGNTGESMFVDLRDRLLNQGGIPSLPPGWLVESALRSASGTPFAGDFLVATVLDDDTRLEVVVVDVSGKGDAAGTRALLLSGAFGGMLGSLAPQDFLRAANDYLMRQGWEEGFATAVHLSLDLRTGRFAVCSAGHPPAVQRHSGSGRWAVLPSAGPVLGLVDEAEFEVAEGVLGPGDAVILYTDGMVERPRRDIEMGLDRMLGQAETLLRGSFVGSAERLVSSLGSPDDDRAMVVVHRR
ncbi:hypothetical protein BKA08_002410 [Nocardioides marinisabuli]|uniref:PPM-type phosphatase domain-containing protein n=1 Tax=Nocardioides marinisabuli TaxID=419476 RepID=A0A7Y9F225_9ACTN|nr:PP2C family protein-serine/threonine phosphatase [Nocardioides marinisabuli]NYD58172.1 hypothetical protein [Nocardioides marinisabuli]